MIASFFAFIQLTLKALSLWEGFLTWLDENYAKDIEVRRQAREAAIERQKNAQDEDAFDKAQDDIVNNRPKP